MKMRKSRAVAGALSVAVIATAMGAVPQTAGAVVEPGTTARVSVATAGTQGNGISRAPDVSDDGRFVVFESTSSDLVGGDTNAVSDIFLHDRQSGATTLISRNSTGALGNGASTWPAISGDGTKVAFISQATNLDLDANEPDSLRDLSTDRDTYLYDSIANTTELVSRTIPAIEGEPYNLDAVDDTRGGPDLDLDGSMVVFPANGSVWRKDVGENHQSQRVSTDYQDGDEDSVSDHPGVNDLGNIIVYRSNSSDLLAPGEDDNGGLSDIFVTTYSPCGEFTCTSNERASESASGASNQGSFNPSISGDGTTVAFKSSATNLVSPETGAGAQHVFVKDMGSDDVQVVDVAPDGVTLGGNGAVLPAISNDGTRVAFVSNSTNLLPDGDDPNGAVQDVFIRDLSATTNAVDIVSASSTGAAGDNKSGELDTARSSVAISGDGSLVTFESRATNLVTGDTNFVAPDNASTSSIGDDVFTREGTPEIANVSLDVTPVSGPAGFDDIATDTIDLGALPLLPDAGELESAPLRSSPLRSSPLRSSPLRSSPLRSSPLRSSPLRSSPLRSSPLRSSALPPMPLSTVPLLVDGGWAAVLAGPVETPYAGLSLQSVTLQQAMALADEGGGATYPQLSALSLADIDLTSTPLRSSSLQAFLFAGPSLDEVSSTKGWCIALGGTFCTEQAIDEAVSTLLDLELAGGDLGQLDVSDLPVDEADLGGAPISHYDIASVDVASTPLGAIAVSSLPAGIVETGFGGATLADAVDANAIVDANTAVLGALLGNDTFVGDLTLGELVRAVIDPAKLSYAAVDLDGLLHGAPLDGEDEVTYTARADVRCDIADDLAVFVQLPPTFRYSPGSSALAVNGQPVPVTDPQVFFLGGIDLTDTLVDTPDGPALDWSVDGADFADSPGVNHVELRFRAEPGIILGLHTSSVSFYSDDNDIVASKDDTAPFNVLEANEDGDGNDTPDSATPAVPGALYLSHIGHADDVDYYELPSSATPVGTRVTAVLSHLPADFDLFIEGPSSAPLRSSPLRSSPLRSSPIEDFDASAADGDALEPDNLEDLPLRSSLLSQSATAGTEDESVTTVTTAETTGQPLTIAVTHHLGSTASTPYMLQVFADPPPELACPPNAFPPSNADVAGSLPASVPSTTKTLFLVNQKRFGDVYGSAAAADVLASLTTLAAGPEVAGAVIPVEGDPAVAAAYDHWDDNRCSPEAANGVVRAIGALVESYQPALPELRYITVVGDDDVIPFARIPDGVTLSNQRDYYPEVVFDGADNPISAAFAYSYLLSDNAYTTPDGIDWLGHQLLVPEYAGGRLVETPDDILGSIAQYTAQPYISLDKTLTTGYDFVADAAGEVDTNLAGNGGGTGSRQTLISDSWTRSDLIDALGSGPTVANVNAHFDHTNTLPAAGNAAPSPSAELFTTDDLAASALPAGALLFTVGCQAGLNVPGLAWAAADTPTELSRLFDFAQTMAQKDGGGFLGNTGFGYGDTAVVAYSERLVSIFADLLDGTMTVGQAVSAARHTYLEAGLPGVYDEKVLSEATFYGLPFIRVGSGGGEGPAPAAPALPGTIDTPSGFAGSPADSFDADQTLTAVSTARGTYYEVDGEQPLISHHRPIQPARSDVIPNPPVGSVLGDVLFTELTSGIDVPLANPVFARPTTDKSTVEPEVDIRGVSFPVSLGSVTPSGTLALFPGQYRSSETTPGSGAQLSFTHMGGYVLYPTSVDAPRPLFERVTGVNRTDGGTRFGVQVDGADHVFVLAKPTGSSVWTNLELTETPAGSGTWTGLIPSGVVAEYFVQAVNDGRVATTRAKGVDYIPQPDADVRLTGTEGDVAPWFRSDVVVNVSNADGDSFTAAVDGEPSAPVPVTVTGDGLHTVDYAGDNGAIGSVDVAVDATPPSVVITNPAPGQTVDAGDSHTAAFTCSDELSGVATCAASDDPSTPNEDEGTLSSVAGVHTFRVNAVDNAGSSTLVAVQYVSTGGYLFEGFFAPVDNPNVLNTVKAGNAIPVKFRLRLGDGTLVTNPAAIQGFTSVQIPCTTSGGIDEIESTVPAGSSSVRYDAATTQFVYNWKTEKAWSGTCRKLTVSFDDGTARFARFQLKK